MLWRMTARCFSTFPARKWRVTGPGSSCGKRTSLIFSVPQRPRTGFLNWNHPPLAWRCLKGYMTVLPSVSSQRPWWQHPVYTCRAYTQGLTWADDPTWKLGNRPWNVSQPVSPQGIVWFLCFTGFWFAWHSLRCLFFFFFLLYFVRLVLNVESKSKRLSHWLLPLPQATPNFYARILLKAGAPWNLWDLFEAFEAEYKEWSHLLP